MNSELSAVLDYWEREKGIKREVLVEAVQTALISASKKAVGPARELRIEIDPKTLSIRAMANLVVVERVVNPHDEIALVRAGRLKPGIGIGESLEVEVTPANFGRIAAQAARQAMMQRIRQAEKEMIYDEFKDRAGEIVSGVVRRFERSDVVLDLGKFEAIMPARERVQSEEYGIGDRIRAYVVAVENGQRGPEIILSRSHPNFVRRLFENEVSEIADRTVEIKAIAREAGYRSKVAVFSKDEKVDPVGACVGMKGSRVKNIVRELNNEKVDIVKWSDNVQEFVAEALKPVVIKRFEVDQPRHAIRIAVGEEDLSQAIGKRGQNARLTSRLCGWEINIVKDESVKEKMAAKVVKGAQHLAEALGIGEELANAMMNIGLNDLEGIVETDPADIAEVLKIEGAEAARIHAAAVVAREKSVAPAE